MIIIYVSKENLKYYMLKAVSKMGALQITLFHL